MLILFAKCYMFVAGSIDNISIEREREHLLLSGQAIPDMALKVGTNIPYYLQGKVAQCKQHDVINLNLKQWTDSSVMFFFFLLLLPKLLLHAKEHSGISPV